VAIALDPFCLSLGRGFDLGSVGVSTARIVASNLTLRPSLPRIVAQDDRNRWQSRGALSFVLMIAAKVQEFFGSLEQAALSFSPFLD
jgi:hypothetical protein